MYSPGAGSCWNLEKGTPSPPLGHLYPGAGGGLPRFRACLQTGAGCFPLVPWRRRLAEACPVPRRMGSPKIGCFDEELQTDAVCWVLLGGYFCKTRCPPSIVMQIHLLETHTGEGGVGVSCWGCWMWLRHTGRASQRKSILISSVFFPPSELQGDTYFQLLPWQE